MSDAPRAAACATVALATSLIIGCAPRAAVVPASGLGTSPRVATSFDRVEEEVLRDLAALDRRLALRAHIEPSEVDLRHVAMDSVLREDASAALHDGAIDPFSFDARGRGLVAIKAKLESARAGDSLERELVSRLVEAEIARLDEERDLPRSASALVRAIVTTYRAPRSERDAVDVDRWLARRLGELHESLGKEPALDLVRARELDDALDALERICAQPTFIKSTQALLRLRDDLEAIGARPPQAPISESSRVEARVRSHLGVTGLDALIERLARVEKELRARALVEVADTKRDELLVALEKLVLVSGPCEATRVRGSLVRSMDAPPEREQACRLVHALATETFPDAVTTAVLHEHVVVALWALEVARGATVADAAARHSLLVPPPPDVRVRYERFALARPVAAIGAGEAARLLARAPSARAVAWAALGDAPLDIIERELSR